MKKAMYLEVFRNLYEAYRIVSTNHQESLIEYIVDEKVLSS